MPPGMRSRAGVGANEPAAILGRVWRASASSAEGCVPARGRLATLSCPLPELRPLTVLGADVAGIGQTGFSSKNAAGA